LNQLHKSLVSAICSIEELGLKSEKDMLFLFPPDMMKYGLGEEVLVEITGLFDKPERTPEIKQRLIRAVAEKVSAFFPKAMVECSVQSAKPEEFVIIDPKT
jgi:hypothetical protein